MGAPFGRPRKDYKYNVLVMFASIKCGVVRAVLDPAHLFFKKNAMRCIKLPGNGRVLSRPPHAGSDILLLLQMLRGDAPALQEAFPSGGNGPPEKQERKRPPFILGGQERSQSSAYGLQAGGLPRYEA